MISANPLVDYCNRLFQIAAVLFVHLGSFDEINPGFPLLHKPFGTTKLSETVKGILPACQPTRKRA